MTATDDVLLLPTLLTVLSCNSVNPTRSSMVHADPSTTHTLQTATQLALVKVSAAVKVSAVCVCV